VCLLVKVSSSAASIWGSIHCLLVVVLVVVSLVVEVGDSLFVVCLLVKVSSSAACVWGSIHCLLVGSVHR